MIKAHQQEAFIPIEWADKMMLGVGVELTLMCSENGEPISDYHIIHR